MYLLEFCLKNIPNCHYSYAIQGRPRHAANLQSGEDVEGSEGTGILVVASVVVEDGVENVGAGLRVEGEQ